MRSDQQEQLYLAVIEQHKGIIYKIAKSFKKAEEGKNDLVQEIIFQLWRAFQGFDERGKLSTWVYRVALNVAISSPLKRQNMVKMRRYAPTLIQYVDILATLLFTFTV